MLISWGTMTAQASPQEHPSNHPMLGYSKLAPHHYQLNFKPNPQEYKEILSVLHIDHRTFERETQRGKSLAKIAAQQHVAEKKVIKLIAKQMRNQIDQDRRERRITAEQAAYMKKHVQEEAKEVVNERWLNSRRGPMHNRFGG
jgi:hypothetical protein